ncbi:hypothetical protein SEEE2558_15191 [Salmonella enterica subsp. enterica serovar Enteritidis str. 22558]|nr:hypothetical protein SEEE2558_15191 [Salmonella enterica subsp. enterica serovar Enteritidis str. 22558]
MQFKNQSSYCTPYYCTEQLITKKQTAEQKIPTSEQI